MLVQNVCTKVVLDMRGGRVMLDTESAKRLGLHIMRARTKGEFGHHNGASRT